MTRSDTVARTTMASAAPVAPDPQSTTTGRGSRASAAASASPRPTSVIVAPCPPRQGSDRTRRAGVDLEAPKGVVGHVGAGGEPVGQADPGRPCGQTEDGGQIAREIGEEGARGRGVASSRPSAAATTVVPLPPFGDQQANSKGTLPGRV